MINKLLQFIAPHHCYGCGKTGTVLCQNCKYDIANERYSGCVVCEKPAVYGICSACKTSYEKAWCAGDKSGTLEAVIGAMKFDRCIDGTRALATLLNDVLPVLPEDTVVVPVPTLPRHIRQRGYDHTYLIAKHLSKYRQLKTRPHIERIGTDQQRGKDKKVRLEQAARSFKASKSLDASVPYLLIDDVTTTEATIRYAAKALKNAGAMTIWVAVAARQPLHKNNSL